MQALRIVTINTGKGDGDYRRRIDWLADELARLHPDIVACQEAFRDQSGALDTAATLAERTGLHLRWSPARFKARDCEGETLASWSGMGLLTRRPLQRLDAIELPTDPADGDRLAQIGTLESGNRRYVIANLHLTHLRERDDLRAEQLRRVLDHPAMRTTDSHRLLCGDFNTTADGPVLSALLNDGASGDLKDTRMLDGGAWPTTLARRNPEAPGRTVDFILSLAEAPDEHPTFTSSAIVLDRPHPDTGLLPSDHLGVATTLLPLTGRLPRRREERQLAV